MPDLLLTFPVQTRERAQIRFCEAEQARGKRPTKIIISATDHARLKKRMARHGYHRGKPLDVFFIPIVAGDVPNGQIGFEFGES